MEINRGVLIAQAINFALILGLFTWLVGGRISKAIAARRAELAKADDATKAYETAVAKAEADKKAIIDEAVAHKNKIVEEASLTATQKAEAIVADAEKKAGAIVSKAEEKAQKLEKDLQSNFVQGVKHTAHVVVKKLFKKDVQLQEEYVEALAKEFSL